MEDKKQVRIKDLILLFGKILSVTILLFGIYSIIYEQYCGCIGHKAHWGKPTPDLKVCTAFDVWGYLPDFLKTSFIDAISGSSLPFFSIALGAIFGGFKRYYLMIAFWSILLIHISFTLVCY